MSESPRLFISHRHQDKLIASTLKKFIRSATNNLVSVFQSSDEESAGTRVGQDLTQTLADELDASEVVVLIYTTQDDDWSYCMWECGVAFDPKQSDTKIVVLQCGADAPAPLQHTVRVQAMDEVSVNQFVIQLLTDGDFFPKYGGKITGLTETDRQVREYGKQLYESLREVIPQQPDWEWPAWPLLKLQLDLEHEEPLKSSDDHHAIELLKDEAIVAESDDYAKKLFNITDLKDKNLKQLIQMWEDMNPGSKSAWTDSLLGQMLEAGRGNFLTPNWRLFKHAMNETWYAPILLFFHRLPRDQRLQFDIYFPEFRSDIGDLSVPSDLTQQN